MLQELQETFIAQVHYYGRGGAPVLVSCWVGPSLPLRLSPVSCDDSLLRSRSLVIHANFTPPHPKWKIFFNFFLYNFQGQPRFNRFFSRFFFIFLHLRDKFCEKIGQREFNFWRKILEKNVGFTDWKTIRDPRKNDLITQEQMNK